MIYDVRDSGQAYGYGVRGSVTSVELTFHTDNAFAVAPPDYVGLLCLQPARRGGVSRFISLYTVHNEMLARHPAALARLYAPVFLDRQAEHAPDGRAQGVVGADASLGRDTPLVSPGADARDQGLRGPGPGAAGRRD